MRPHQHELEGIRPVLGASSTPHQFAIFQALVHSNLQAWILLAAIEDDFDERRGQKLRASKKLPPLVNYGSHDVQRNCGDDCAICLEDFQDGQRCQVLCECKHTFHSECIDRWLQKKLTCPICRSCI